MARRILSDIALPETPAGDVLSDDGTFIPMNTSGSTIIDGSYRFDPSITASDPGNGDLRIDNAIYSLVENIYISQLGNNDADVSNILAALATGDTIYIQDRDDASKWFRADITSAPTDNGTWWTIPVEYVSSGGSLFSNNAILGIIVAFNSGNITSALFSRIVTITGADFTAGSGESTDYTYFINGNHTPTLPTLVDNTNRYTFINLHSDNITIDPDGATINGEAVYTLAPEQRVEIQGNEVEWYTIDKPKITVGTDEPINPAINDIWIDTN